MSKDASQIGKVKQGSSRRRWMITGGAAFVVLLVLGYFALVRPVVVMVSGPPFLTVKNTGGLDALIYRVDGFWYWAGQVALLGNMPPIGHRVQPGEPPVRLGLPHIPAPEGDRAREGPWYMKLVVHYKIPHNPVFRYKTLLYFEFDPERNTWKPTEAIPAKYRALGNLGIGNVGNIELSFDRD